MILYTLGFPPESFLGGVFCRCSRFGRCSRFLGKNAVSNFPKAALFRQNSRSNFSKAALFWQNSRSNFSKAASFLGVVMAGVFSGQEVES